MQADNKRLDGKLMDSAYETSLLLREAETPSGVLAPGVVRTSGSFEGYPATVWTLPPQSYRDGTTITTTAILEVPYQGMPPRAFVRVRIEDDYRGVFGESTVRCVDAAADYLATL